MKPNLANPMKTKKLNIIMCVCLYVSVCLCVCVVVVHCTLYTALYTELGLVTPCRCGKEDGAEDGAASANLPCGLERDSDEATLKVLS